MEQADKNIHDEFMLREYESIAAAHFDSQAGLRQQFRFYLIIAAVPWTVLGIAGNHPAQPVAAQTLPMGLSFLPLFASDVFIGIGALGILMTFAMIHTAFDCVLYARTVNGVRAYFGDRAKRLAVDLQPYLVMPMDKYKPKYVHYRAFFYQHTLMSLVNAVYITLGIENIWHRPCLSTMFFLVFAGLQAIAYPLMGWRREKKQIAD
jgi:hypothetical protein